MAGGAGGPGKEALEKYKTSEKKKIQEELRSNIKKIFYVVLLFVIEIGRKKLFLSK